jgi:SAM-dependent methyltransferase
MSYLDYFYPESKFGGFTDIDGTITFYTRVNALLESSFVILDVGCGRGSYMEDQISVRKNLRIFKGKVKKVIGIDVDHTAAQNPFITDFFLIADDRWAVNDNSIDLIICDNVLEHVEKPDFFFTQVNRVLKPGGYICIRTPNAHSYIALFSKLIPNKYHSKITAIVQDGRKEEDVFPAYYRCNTVGKIKSRLNFHNYENVVYGYEAEPSYLSFFKIAYRFGVLHQRFSPGFLKPAIFAFGRKNNTDLFES